MTTLIRFIVIRYVQCFLGNSYICTCHHSALLYAHCICTLYMHWYMHTVYALVYAHCICTGICILYMHTVYNGGIFKATLCLVAIWFIAV